MIGPCLRRDLRHIVSQKDKQATLGTGMFERERHQGFSEPVQKDLAGNGLRSLDYGADVKLLKGGSDCGRRCPR